MYDIMLCHFHLSLAITDRVATLRNEEEVVSLFLERLTTGQFPPSVHLVWGEGNGGKQLGNGVAWRRKTARKGDRHEKKRWFVDCVFILLILVTALAMFYNVQLHTITAEHISYPSWVFICFGSITLAGGYDKND